MANKNWEICLICNKTDFKNANSFTKHLRKHKITTKDYYIQYINETNEICRCGKVIGFASIIEGFPKLCRTCNNKHNPERLRKIKATMMRKYGADNASKVEEFKEKRAQTNMERFGVRHAMSNPEIMNRCKKTWEENYEEGHPGKDEKIKLQKKKTCQEKYGVDNPSSVEEFKEKRIQTNLELYGSEHAMKNPEIYKRFKKGMIKKYGVEHALQKEEFFEKSKKTCLKNHGVEWGMQDPNVAAKISGSNSYRWVKDREQRFAPYTEKFLDDNYRKLIREEQTNLDPLSGDELEESAHLHHIDYDKSNDLRENLIFLNQSNHFKTNTKRNHWKKILSGINQTFINQVQ